MSPGFTIYEAGTSLAWDGDTKICLFKFFQQKHYCLWVPSHIGLKGNENTDFAAKSALELPRAKIGVSHDDFKHKINKYFLSTWQDNWNGAVANKTFIVRSRSWETGSPLTGGAGRMDLFYVVSAHLIHSYILKKDHPPQCEHCQHILRVRYISVECNLAQARKDIFGRKNVLESFRLHPIRLLSNLMKL